MGWNDLSFKEKVGYSISISSFLMGIVITLMGMLLPPIGSIDPTVLTASGEFLSLSAVLLGIHQYVSSEKHSLNRTLKDLIDKLDENNNDEEKIQ